MKLSNLIANLENADPKIRLEIVQVLGLVQETEALKAIGARYNVETDPAVKEALGWAGKRIYAAQKDGYTTQGEIFKRFKIEKEIQKAVEKVEEDLMKQMQQNLEIEMIRRQQNAAQSKVNTAVAAGIAGTVLSGGMMGANMVTGALQAGADIASSNIGGDRPEIGKSRIPATMPGTININRWVKTLHNSDDSSQRIHAAKELQHLNNPAALPHLAEAYIHETNEKVKKKLQKAGIRLYISTVYWHMEQDGTLQAEIDQRLEEAGISPAQESPTAPQPTEPPAKKDTDLDAILRKAKQARINRDLKD